MFFCSCFSQKQNEVYVKITVTIESITFFQQPETITSRFTDFSLSINTTTTNNENYETPPIQCLGERIIDLHPESVTFSPMYRLPFKKRERASRENLGRLEWRLPDEKITFGLVLRDEVQDILILRNGEKAIFTSEEKDDALLVQTVVNSPTADSGSTLLKAKFRDKSNERLLAEIEYSWARGGLVAANELPAIPIVHDPTSVNAPLLWSQVELDLSALRGPKVPTRPFRVRLDFGGGRIQISPKVSSTAPTPLQQSILAGFAGEGRLEDTASIMKDLGETRRNMILNLLMEDEENSKLAAAHLLEQRESRSSKPNLSGTFSGGTATTNGSSPRNLNSTTRIAAIRQMMQRRQFDRPIMTFFQPIPKMMNGELDEKARNNTATTFRCNDFGLQIVLEDAYDLGCVETDALLKMDGRMVRGIPSSTDSSSTGFTVKDADNNAATLASSPPNTNVRIFNTPFGTITAKITIHFRSNTSNFHNALAQNWVDHAQIAIGAILTKAGATSDGQSLCDILKEWQIVLAKRLDVFLSSTDDQRNGTNVEAINNGAGKPANAAPMITSLAYACEAALDFYLRIFSPSSALRVPADVLLDAANRAVLGNQDATIPPGAKYFMLGFDKPNLKRRVNLSRGSWNRVAGWMSAASWEQMERAVLMLPSKAVFPPVYLLSVAMRGALTLYGFYKGYGGGTIGAAFTKRYQIILIGIAAHLQDIESDPAASQCLERLYEAIFEGVSYIETFAQLDFSSKVLANVQANKDLGKVEQVLVAAQKNVFQFLAADRTRRILLRVAGNNSELKKIADSIDVAKKENQDQEKQLDAILEKVENFVSVQKEIMDKLTQVLGAQHALKFQMNLGIQVLQEGKEKNYHEALEMNKLLMKKVDELRLEARAEVASDLLQNKHRNNDNNHQRVESASNGFLQVPRQNYSSHHRSYSQEGLSNNNNNDDDNNVSPSCSSVAALSPGVFITIGGGDDDENGNNNNNVVISADGAPPRMNGFATKTPLAPANSSANSSSIVAKSFEYLNGLMQLRAKLSDEYRRNFSTSAPSAAVMAANALSKNNNNNRFQQTNSSSRKPKVRLESTFINMRIIQSSSSSQNEEEYSDAMEDNFLRPHHERTSSLTPSPLPSKGSVAFDFLSSPPDNTRNVMNQSTSIPCKATKLPNLISAATSSPVVVVTGPAGVGKTTMCHQLCIEQNFDDALLVFVPLRDLRQKEISSIEILLETVAADFLGPEDVHVIVSQQIPILWFVDGLDEVQNVTPSQDKFLADFLKNFVDPKTRIRNLKWKTHPNLIRKQDLVIVTSRPERSMTTNISPLILSDVNNNNPTSHLKSSAYQQVCNLDVEGVDHWKILPWTKNEIREFCLKYFTEFPPLLALAESQRNNRNDNNNNNNHHRTSKNNNNNLHQNNSITLNTSSTMHAGSMPGSPTTIRNFGKLAHHHHHHHHKNAASASITFRNASEIFTTTRNAFETKRNKSQEPRDMKEKKQHGISRLNSRNNNDENSTSASSSSSSDDDDDYDGVDGINETLARLLSDDVILANGPLIHKNSQTTRIEIGADLLEQTLAAGALNMQNMLPVEAHLDQSILIRHAADDVVEAIYSGEMDFFAGLPVVVQMLCEIRYSKPSLSNISASIAFEKMTRHYWERAAKSGKLEDFFNARRLKTYPTMDNILLQAASDGYRQLVYSERVTEVEFEDESQVPLWAELLVEIGLLDSISATQFRFPHRTFLEFLCAKHVATHPNETLFSNEPTNKTIEWGPKFATVWILLADFVRRNESFFKSQQTNPLFSKAGASSNISERLRAEPFLEHVANACAAHVTKLTSRAGAELRKNQFASPFLRIAYLLGSERILAVMMEHLSDDSLREKVVTWLAQRFATEGVDAILPHLEKLRKNYDSLADDLEWTTLLNKALCRALDQQDRPSVANCINVLLGKGCHVTIGDAVKAHSIVGTSQVVRSASFEQARRYLGTALISGEFDVAGCLLAHPGWKEQGKAKLRAIFSVLPRELLIWNEATRNFATKPRDAIAQEWDLDLADPETIQPIEIGDEQLAAGLLRCGTPLIEFTPVSNSPAPLFPAGHKRRASVMLPTADDNFPNPVESGQQPHQKHSRSLSASSHAEQVHRRSHSNAGLDASAIKKWKLVPGINKESVVRIDTTGLPSFRCFLPNLIAASATVHSRSFGGHSQQHQQLPSLRYLDLEGISILGDLARIANPAAALSELRFLNLRRTDVTNESLVFVASVGALRHLEHLDLGRVLHINDAALTAVARYCPKLKFLSIAHAKNDHLSDASVVEIGTRGFSHLTHLDVSHTKGRVTERAISHLLSTIGEAQRRKQDFVCPLESLNVGSTGGLISVKSLEMLLVVCAPGTFTFLDFSGNNFSETEVAKGEAEEFVAKMKERFPRIQIKY